jgi:antitoxin ParD1/3/4
MSGELPTLICPYHALLCGVNRRMEHRGLKLVTIHLPEAFLEGIEELVKSRIYPNRSEAIRIAVRDLLKNELWERPTSVATAAIAAR